VSGRGWIGAAVWLLAGLPAWGQEPPVYKAAPVEQTRLAAFDERGIAALDIFRYPHPNRQDQPETVRVNDPAVLAMLESEAVYDLRPLLTWRGIPIPDTVRAYFDRGKGWVYYSGPAGDLDYLNAWLQPMSSEWDSYIVTIAQSFRIFQESLPAVPDEELPWPTPGSLQGRKLRLLGGSQLNTRSGTRTRINSSEVRPPSLVEATLQDEFLGLSRPHRHSGDLWIEVDPMLNPDAVTLSRSASVALKSTVSPDDDTPVEWQYESSIDTQSGTAFVEEPVMAAYPHPHRVVMLNRTELHKIEPEQVKSRLPGAVLRWLRQGAPPAHPLPPAPGPLESVALPVFADQLVHWASSSSPGAPPYYAQNEPFQLDPAITRPLCGERPVINLTPFFRRGGAPTYEGCAAWLAPHLNQIFLRYPAESMSLVREFLAKIPAPELPDKQFAVEVRIQAPGDQPALLYRLRQITRRGNWSRQAYGIGREKVYLPGTATVDRVEKHEEVRGGSKLQSVEAGVSLEVVATPLQIADANADRPGEIELMLEVKLPESSGPGARVFENTNIKAEALKSGESFPFTLRPAPYESDSGEKLEGTVRWTWVGTNLSAGGEEKDTGWEARWKAFEPPK